jgi:hypothetical protein
MTELDALRAAVANCPTKIASHQYELALEALITGLEQALRQAWDDQETLAANNGEQWAELQKLSRENTTLRNIIRRYRDGWEPARGRPPRTIGWRWIRKNKSGEWEKKRMTPEERAFFEQEAEERAFFEQEAGT